MDLPLRERKKQQTQQALIESAYRLFAQNGYDNTTLADICAGANCSRRTFFRYFRSKEDLLLVGIDALWEDLTEVLKGRPADMTTLQALEGWAAATTQAFLDKEHPLMEVLDQESGNTSLSVESRRALYSMTTMQTVLIPEFAKDLDVSADATGPRLLAAATAAVFDAFHSDVVLEDEAKTASLRMAILLLEGAFGSLKSSVS